MSSRRGVDRRRYPRIETTVAVSFNLNPDYHHVPGIRKLGVGGTVRSISPEGIRIESQMDVQDVCQIFPEAIEEASPFELEVTFRDTRGRRTLLKGSVRWYRLSEPNGEIRHFHVGLYLKDDESINIAKGIIESVTGNS